MAIRTTLTYSEENRGWTSFWSYEPLYMFSIAGSYYSINEGTLHEHYVNGIHSNFYGVQYDSEVTLIFNDMPSLQKTFQTINYEGTNGWEAVDITSDEYRPTTKAQESVSDSAKDIKSYSEGKYIYRGVEVRAGFKRNENKYYSELRNSTTTLREGQVRVGEKLSGIKGFFATVTMKTDQTSGAGGQKQLFSVGSGYTQSII